MIARLLAFALLSATALAQNTVHYTTTNRQREISVRDR